MKVIAALTAFVAAVLPTISEARPAHHHHRYPSGVSHHRQNEDRKAARIENAEHEEETSSHSGLGPKPAHAWCGWWMRSRHGGGPVYNLAWAWAKRGQPSDPHTGAIAVFRHHVVELVEHVKGNIWIAISGNDGNRVRTRPRSIQGAVIRAL